MKSSGVVDAEGIINFSAVVSVEDGECTGTLGLKARVSRSSKALGSVGASMEYCCPIAWSRSVTGAYPVGYGYVGRGWGGVAADVGIQGAASGIIGVGWLPLSELRELFGPGITALWAPHGCLFFAPGGLPFFLGPCLCSVSVTEESPSRVPHT